MITVPTGQSGGYGHVVDRLRPFDWDSEAAFAYEAAVEALNGLVGACTAAIGAAKARGDRDTAVALAARRADCHRRRTDLDPGDARAVARVRAEASAAASALRTTGGGRAAPATAHTEATEATDPLTEEHNSRIFHEEIVPDLLDGIAHRTAPVAVVLLGQQGASKTRMAEEIARRLGADGGFADIDADYYKPYHPAYDGLLVSDDRVMAMRTGRDGQRWMRLALSRAREQRFHILVHETAQSPSYLEEMLRALRRDGYLVEVLVLGVTEAMSRLGILKRYHEQIRDRGHGRLTVGTKATRSYRGILEAADLIDSGRLADAVAVVRRGGHLCHHNGLREPDTPGGASRWAEPPALRAAIDRERSRAWSEAETADFRRVHARLVAEMAPKWLDELDQIAALADAPAPSPDGAPPAADAPETTFDPAGAVPARAADTPPPQR